MPIRKNSGNLSHAPRIYIHIDTHTHTHTHLYTYIYIYIYVCVCVCGCYLKNDIIVTEALFYFPRCRIVKAKEASDIIFLMVMCVK